MRQRLFRIILSLAFSMMTVVTGMASEPGQGTEIIMEFPKHHMEKEAAE